MEEDFKYPSDYIDAFCEEYYGHTNWGYEKSTDPNVAVTIVIYKDGESS